MIQQRNASEYGIIDALRELERIRRKIITITPIKFYPNGATKEWAIFHDDNKELIDD